MQRLTLGPITILHRYGEPYAVEGSDETDGLPPDVAEELLECPAVLARCTAAAEDDDPQELVFEDDREAVDDADCPDYPED